MAQWDDVFSTPGTSATVTLRLIVTVASQSTSLNRSTLSWSLRMIKGTTGNPSRAFNDCDASASVNGSVLSRSDLNYAFASGPQTIVVASGTRNVTHDPDGTKSISVSASYNGYSPIGTAAITTKTMVLPKINRATTPTITPNPIDFGQLLTFNLASAVATYTHSISVGLGVETDDVAVNVGDGDYTWTVPLSWMSQIPNASTAVLTVVTNTVDEDFNEVGSVTSSVTVNVPSTVVPTIGAITDSETVSSVNTLVGKYVQGKSKLALAMTGSAGAYGSTIVSSKIAFDAEIINASSGTMTNAIVGSGTLVATATVIDSRGRIGTLTKNIDVLAYTPPSITTALIQRSDSGGTVDAENGTYVRVDLNAAVSSLLNGVTQKNALQYKLSYRAPGASTWIVKTGPITPGGITYNSHFQSSGFPVTNPYELLVEVIDIFGTATIQRSIPVGAVFMHWDGSVGVGIGKYRQSGMLDVKGQIYQNNGLEVLDTADFSTDAETIAGLLATKAVTPASLLALLINDRPIKVSFTAQTNVNIDTLTGADEYDISWNVVDVSTAGNLRTRLRAGGVSNSASVYDDNQVYGSVSTTGPSETIDATIWKWSTADAARRDKWGKMTLMSLNDAAITRFIGTTGGANATNAPIAAAHAGRHDAATSMNGVELIFGTSTTGYYVVTKRKFQ